MGGRTSQMKVLDIKSDRDSHKLTVQLEAPAGSAHRLFVRRNSSKQHPMKAENATLVGDELLITFGPSSEVSGTNYVTKTVTLRW
jgi:hypothetical protein